MRYHLIKKWYERPLLCILGKHNDRPHPSNYEWKVCKRCDSERY